MPTYVYYCEKCDKEVEVSKPMKDVRLPEAHVCGTAMQRRFGPFAIVAAPDSGRQKVLKTLNKEEGGYGFPGGDMHRPRYEQAMARGLDQTRPVIGRGFG